MTVMDVEENGCNGCGGEQRSLSSPLVRDFVGGNSCSDGFIQFYV